MCGKDGKCPICIPQHGVVNNEANLAFTIFAPYLLPNFVTVLRLICREKICEDQFFRPVEDLAYATEIC